MIRIQLVLRRPIEEAFDYFADFRNENEWNVVAHDFHMLTAPPVGVGSRFRGEYDRMGTLEYEIIEYERPRHLRVRGSSQSFDFSSTFDFSGGVDGTTICSTMDPHPKGVMKLLKPVMGLMIKGQMSKGMASLKRVLEARPSPA